MSKDIVLFLADSAVKGSIVLLACWVGTVLMRRSPAAARHLVWTTGVMAILALPVVTVVVPAITVPVSWLSQRASSGEYTRASAGENSAGVNSRASAGEQSEAAVPHTPAYARTRPLTPEKSPELSVSLLLLMIWAAGTTVSLAALAGSMLRVARLRRTTVRVTTGPCVLAVQRAAARLRMRRVPAVHVGDERVMPMVWGLFRPVLLLPTGAARWSSTRLDSVLMHELAHIRRRDPLTQFIAELARAVYWFNPLVWLAAQRLYLEREHACDDVVLNAGTRPSEYAGELLELVRSLRTTRTTAMAAIAMARPAQLKVRLTAVLDEARARQSLTGRFVTSLCLLGVLILVPIAAVHPQARASAIPILPASASGENSAGENSRASAGEEVPHTPAYARIRPHTPEAQPKASAAAPAMLPNQENCWARRGSRNTSINSNHDDDIRTMKWSMGRCSGSLRIEGRIRFSDDFTTVQSLSSGGLFRLEEDDGDTDRRLVVRNSNGALQYEYRVNGRDQSFDAAGRTWLAQALLNMVRTTGFMAEERVDQLLRSGGPNAVIAEVGQLNSDYVRRMYLSKLLDRAELTPAQVKQAMEVAARDISSDYELAQLLIAFANRYPLTDETRPLFINASNSIESDYEQRRVLATALAKAALKPADLTAMLGAARNINSDYERAQLLLGISSKYALEPQMRLAYLSAAREISSDYEKGRVFKNLIKQGRLNAAELSQVLEYAASIRSDYEKAQLLMELSSFDFSDPALQRAYLNAAEGISSDYEHRRVLTSLLGKQPLTDTNLDLVLRSAVNIDSDYELAQVLMLVLQKHTLDAKQTEAFRKALNSINSDHEYGRVAAALLRKTN